MFKSKNYQTVQVSQSLNHSFADAGNAITALLKGEMGFMLIACLAFIAFMSIFGRPKGKLAQSRFANGPEKLAAVREAQKQIQEKKHNQVTLFAGTPKSKGIWAQVRALLFNDLPTLYIPHAQQGVVVCGAPNSGKTYSILDPAIRAAIDQGFPACVYDFKGSQLEAHAAYAAAQGYQVYVFAPGYPYSGVINLLDFLRDTEGDALMAGELAQIINKNTKLTSNTTDNEFFTNAGDKLVEAVMMLAKSTPYPDLLMAKKILNLPNLPARIVAAKQRGAISPWIYESFSQAISLAGAEETISGVIGNAARPFDKFVKRDLISSFCGDTNIPLYLQGKQILFLQVDREKREVLAPLIAAVLHLVVTHNFAHPRKEPLILGLDELVTLYLPDLAKWTNELRSMGFVPLLGYQNQAQMYHRYGRDLTNSIFAACGTKVFFNPRHRETASDLSGYLGEKEIKIETKSRSTGQRRSVSYSEQYYKVPLMTTEEILTMDRGDCIFINPAYRGGGRASVPLRLKVRIPAGDDKAQQRSEALWQSKVCPRLVERATPTQLDNAQLKLYSDVREELAARLFLLPAPHQQEPQATTGAQSQQHKEGCLEEKKEEFELFA